MTADFELAQMDCVEWLKTIEDETVDLIVCDSAYASLEKHRAIGTTTRLTADWFEVMPNERWPEFLLECYRVLKRDTIAYFLADEETTHDVTRPAAVAAGFTFAKTLTWVKTKKVCEPEELEAENVRIGMGYTWRAASERIAMLRKGKRRLNHLGWPDVLCYPRVTRDDVGRDPYPTEKPVDMLKRLILNSADFTEGAPRPLVIDPFMGAASTGAAALWCGARFAGTDISPRAVGLARERLYGTLVDRRGHPTGFYPSAHGRVLTPRRGPAQGALFT